MAKWDSSEQLPASLKNNNINILPNSRSSYVLGDFLLYEKIPELVEHVKNMPSVSLPELQTVDKNNITSEANAINILQLSGILEDFLEIEEEDTLYATFDGRMSSGSFSFMVKTIDHDYQKIDVAKAQLEIDGGFESTNSVVILEAKNVVHEDFHVRQLYYPFRLWNSKVSKPIRLIFCVYSNKIFRLFEYKFEDKNNYSSIYLVKKKNYSLEDTKITLDELIETYKACDQNILDDRSKTNVPFVQADRFDRVISLLENMKDNEMSGPEIEDLMKFTDRQKDYYFNAGRYLNLFEKFKGTDRIIKYRLTPLGNTVCNLTYKDRQLKLVSLILSHEIFKELFQYILDSGVFPTKEKVIEIELKYNVCGPGAVAIRRSGTVIGWLKWIFSLPNV